MFFYMKTIILDTDFIINAVKYKISLESSIKEISPEKCIIAIIDKTLDELKNKPFEKLSKELIAHLNIIKTKKDKTVDELILGLYKENRDIIVATQDRELKEKLKKGRIPIITIRQQKYLVLYGA